LLYAQVRQADNQDFRNIPLDDKRLDWRVRIEEDKQVNRFAKYDAAQRQTLKEISINNWKDELSYGKLQHAFKLAETDLTNKDATKYGTTAWSNSEIAQWLALYGLPEKSSLSVLVVEILPTITNLYEHISALSNQTTKQQIAGAASTQQHPRPLSDALGQHRILRTSPLTEVPFVC
jgi:hypothetical protein